MCSNYSVQSEMVNELKPLLGITMGDPGGIGAEIIVKSLARDPVQEICRPQVTGKKQKIAIG